MARKLLFRLVLGMLDSSRNWMNMYFFVQGTDGVCELEEWDSMLDRFDKHLGYFK